MELRLLKYFIAIVEMGSLTKAAQLVHVAQPALSQAVSALEHELKVALLLRNSQGVTPTAAGKLLYRHAVTIVRMVEAARFEVSAPDNDRGEAGDVAIGIAPTIMPLIGFSLFERLRAEYPRIRLQIAESEGGRLGQQLLQGRLDIILAFRQTPLPRTSIFPVIEERLFLVGDGPANADDDIACQTEQLDGLTMALPSALHGIREVIEDAFEAAGVQPVIIADIDSVDVLWDVAKSGLASTILPFSALLCRFDEQVQVRQLDPPIWRRISMLTLDPRIQSGAALVVKRLVLDLMHEAVLSGRLRGARIVEA